MLNFWIYLIVENVSNFLLGTLLRQHQLSEVDDLYRKGQYEILASTLTECFKYCAQQVDIDNPELDSLPDRPTQMAMLLDSLWQLKRYSVSQLYPFYYGKVLL